MINSTVTDITFGGAGYNRVAAKHEDFHSTAPAHKQVNKEMLQSTTSLVY